jgi:hypothetical protein
MYSISSGWLHTRTIPRYVRLKYGTFSQRLHREEITGGTESRPVRRNPLSPGADISRYRPIGRTLALDERAIGDS